MLEKQHIHIDATDGALNYLADVGFDPQFGARPIKRVIQKRIMNHLSKEILAGKVDKDGLILIDTEGDSLVFRNAPAELPEIE